MFAGNFAPIGWALCQGQILSIAENDVLFQLIGTTYGGDGQQTFALPDLQGRVPIHMGTLPGGSTYIIGQNGGAEIVTLTPQQIPAHTHQALCASGPGNSPSPAGAFWASDGAARYASGNAPLAALNSNTVTTAGGNQPHDNVVPFLAINFIISLFGIFPSPT
jgi:microcystin-dependent protein